MEWRSRGSKRPTSRGDGYPWISGEKWSQNAHLWAESICCCSWFGFIRPALFRNLHRWDVFETELLSDHWCIIFEFKCKNCSLVKTQSKGWATKKLNKNAFCEYIANVTETDEIWTPDHMVEFITTALSRACDTSMPWRYGGYKHY